MCIIECIITDSDLFTVVLTGTRSCDIYNANIAILLTIQNPAELQTTIFALAAQYCTLCPSIIALFIFAQ